MINKISTQLNKQNLKIAVRIAAVMLLLLLIAPRLTLENIMLYESVSLPLGMLALFIIYALKPVIMIIPVNMLYVAAGLIFPVGWAILITYIGLSIALSIGYINGKRLGENKVNKVLAKNKRAAAFLENHADNMPSLCFIVRLLPFPKDLFSMFFGAVGMTFGKFIIISLMGVSPVMLSTVIAGAYIANPLSPEFLVPFGASLGIMLILFIAYRIVVKKIIAKKKTRTL